MAIHGDTWPLVAEHVGSHYVLECITHFLQLPIEDDFLDELEHRALHAAGPRSAQAAGPDAAANGSGGDTQGFGYVPLAGTDAAPGNPVMSMVRGKLWHPRLRCGEGRVCVRL